VIQVPVSAVPTPSSPRPGHVSTRIATRVVSAVGHHPGGSNKSHADDMPSFVTQDTQIPCQKARLRYVIIPRKTPGNASLQL